MAFRILNNDEANIGLTNLKRNKRKLSELEQKLATGLRIVRASDDATDLFIADNLKQTYVGLERGTQNAQYGLALSRTVDDALGKIYDILVKIKDKIVEAANSHTDAERKQAQQQINEYVRNIAQIVNQTEFDGFKPLAGDVYTVHYGSHSNEFMILNGSGVGDQTGTRLVAEAGSSADKPANLWLSVKNNTAVADKFANYEGITGQVYYVQVQQATATVNVLTYSDARKSLEEVEGFMTTIDHWRGVWGALENKLQNIIENNQVMIDNLKEGESKVRNIDYASAFAEFRKMQIVAQANITALAQANQIPQLVLQLLR